MLPTLLNIIFLSLCSSIYFLIPNKLFYSDWETHKTAAAISFSFNLLSKEIQSFFLFCQIFFSACFPLNEFCVMSLILAWSTHIISFYFSFPSFSPLHVFVSFMFFILVKFAWSCRGWYKDKSFIHLPVLCKMLKCLNDIWRNVRKERKKEKKKKKKKL